jgi:hypothetical protein
VPHTGAYQSVSATGLARIQLSSQLSIDI